MNTLRRNKIKISWSLAYFGILNNLLSIEDFLKEMDIDFLKKINDEIISELYLKSEDSKEIFLNYIKQIGEVTDLDIKESSWAWSIALLNDVLVSNDQIHEKLRKICDVWAKFNYPPDWKHFIYYMPSSTGISIEEDVYNQFLLFMKNENEKFIGLNKEK